MSGCEPATLALVRDRRLAKGDVLEVARLAGIMAAKRTGELIPLCHPLGLDSVELALTPVEPDAIRIEATVKVHGRTGVEMEALTAVSVAALTVYDMCKAVDRGMVIAQIQLEEKTGGRRGTYRRVGCAVASIRPACRLERESGNRLIRESGWEGLDVVTTAGSESGKAGAAWRLCTRRSRPSWPRPSGSFRTSWGADSRSCNTWWITAPTFKASGCGRPWCCSRAGRAARFRDAHPVLAAVVEMIHTATLVHDDILDEAMVRRHAATVNAEWGNETAVLLGDYLFTHAFHLAASLDSTRACRWIGHATNKVCEGEMQQVHHRGNLDLDEGDYFAIIEGKTAELTAVSCRLGASYAGAPEATVAALDRYGRNLGIAFQIADDVLDIWGEERVTGKSLGTDLEKQKLTLPVIHLLRVVEPAAAAAIRGLLGEAEGRAAAATPAPSREDRRPRLRLAVRQAARQAGRRRPRLPGRFRRQVGAAASWPSTWSGARRDRRPRAAGSRPARDDCPVPHRMSAAAPATSRMSLARASSRVFRIRIASGR